MENSKVTQINVLGPKFLSLFSDKAGHKGSLPAHTIVKLV